MKSFSYCIYLIFVIKFLDDYDILNVLSDFLEYFSYLWKSTKLVGNHKYKVWKGTNFYQWMNMIWENILFPNHACKSANINLGSIQFTFKFVFLVFNFNESLWFGMKLFNLSTDGNSSRWSMYFYFKSSELIVRIIVRKNGA